MSITLSTDEAEEILYALNDMIGYVRGEWSGPDGEDLTRGDLTEAKEVANKFAERITSST